MVALTSTALAAKSALEAAFTVTLVRDLRRTEGARGRTPRILELMAADAATLRGASWACPVAHLGRLRFVVESLERGQGVSGYRLGALIELAGESPKGPDALSMTGESPYTLADELAAYTEATVDLRALPELAQDGIRALSDDMPEAMAALVTRRVPVSWLRWVDRLMEAGIYSYLGDV